MGTNRLESFSDGVIAVAITLLVLGLTVPSVGAHASLIGSFGARWPEYAAYVTSFLTIGIIWINHHVTIGRLRATDHSILILNLLLLMSIGLLPFATAVMAAYLRQPSHQAVAAAIYSGAFLLMSVFFALLNRHILMARAHLIAPELTLEQRRRILVRFVPGLVPYLLATVLAFVSAYVTLGICFAVAAYYALPIASGVDQGS